MPTRARDQGRAERADRHGVPALNAVPALRRRSTGGVSGASPSTVSASLACDRFEMDEWGVDVMVAACQKGLMTPPGLTFFVWANGKALTGQRPLPQPALTGTGARG